MEKWKDIIGYEGYYQISSFGNVKNVQTNKILIGDTNNAGYKRVTLYKPVKKRFFIHRLVAAAFLPTPAQIDYVLHHIDNQKTNNNKDNLVWLSVQQHNKVHAKQRKQEEQEQAT